MEDSELREYTHGMLGSVAEALGRRFAPFLPHAVEAALASCAQAGSGPGCLLHALLLPRQPQQVHARGRALPTSVLRDSLRPKGVPYCTSHKALREACHTKSLSAESQHSWNSSECAEGLYCELRRRMAQLGDDSEEEGSAEARSESLDSEDADGESEDEEAASRRLNVRTGERLLTASVGALCMLPCCSTPGYCDLWHSGDSRLDCWHDQGLGTLLWEASWLGGRREPCWRRAL